jgi:hypothetical protein
MVRSDPIICESFRTYLVVLSQHKECGFQVLCPLARSLGDGDNIRLATLHDLDLVLDLWRIKQDQC